MPEWVTIPNEASIIVNVRIPPKMDVERVLTEIFEKLIHEIGGNTEVLEDCEISLSALENFEGYYISDAWLHSSIVKTFINVLTSVKSNIQVSIEPFTNDGRYFASMTPVVNFGVIREENNIHGSNEFVYVEDLRCLKEAIVRVATTRF